MVRRPEKSGIGKSGAEPDASGLLSLKLQASTNMEAGNP
jgi:hypothetical protein